MTIKNNFNDYTIKVSSSSSTTEQYEKKNK